LRIFSLALSTNKRTDNFGFAAGPGLEEGAMIEIAIWLLILSAILAAIVWLAW
jgi:hypothetical protein